MKKKEFAIQLNKFKKEDLIEVEWIDAASLAIDWTRRAEFDWAKELNEVAYINSIGYLYDYNDKFVLLSQNISKDTIAHIIAIPSGMVEKVRKLK